MVMSSTHNGTSNPDAEKYKYQSKERDVESGYDYFEARLYDSATGRFLQVDPLAEKFPTFNSYAGMAANPIIKIDPTGKAPDDYGLSENGDIVLLRKTNDKKDKLIALDKNGKETNKTIEVKKGILDKKETAKTQKGKEYDALTVKGNDSADKLFDFVSNNSNVEWSQTTTKDETNIISTGKQEHSEPSAGNVIVRLLRNDKEVVSHKHSHPTSTRGPSGYRPDSKKSGDKKFAKWIKKKSPKTKLYVYEKKTKKTIQYDDKGIIK